MDISSIINVMMKPLIGLIILAFVLKYVKGYLDSRESKKEVEVARSHEDRIFIGLKNIAKASSLLVHKPLIMKGDSLVPPHKTGETVTGVIPMPDSYVTFIRPRWWQFWKTPMCIEMEPELASDLNGGELHVMGRGLYPIGDRYAYVIPPAKYYQEISIEDIEKRRSRIALKRSVQLLNLDLNNDIPENIKTALRGHKELARRELYESGVIPRKRKDQYEREQERKREEIEESAQSSNQYQQIMQGGAI